MNISCAICSDLYVPSSILYCTPCGHIFHQECLNSWLERSPTCPECRNRCGGRKSIFRIFINICTNLDTSIDVGTLSNKVDTLSMEMREKDTALKKHTEKELKMKSDLKKSSKVIKELEEQLKKKEHIILAHMEEASVLRGECKRIEAFKRENNEIQAKLDLMTTVESLLTSTTSDVEEILAKDVDRKALAVTVASLRRELKASDYRKNELRKVLQGNQNDLRAEIARRRKLEEKLSIADSENYRLKNEVEKMENDILLHVCHSEETDSEKSTNESSLLNRNIMKRSFSKSLDSPSIPEKVQEIMESTSPYLNIKSSIVGLSPLFLNRNIVLTNDDVAAGPSTSKTTTTTMTTIKTEIRHALDSKFSIFKQPRLSTKTATCKSNNLVFNGFGGSERKESFPDFPNRFGVTPRAPLNENHNIPTNSRMAAAPSKYSVKRSKMDKLSRPGVGSLNKFMINKSPAKDT